MRQFRIVVFLCCVLSVIWPVPGMAASGPEGALKALSAAIRDKDIDAFKKVVDVGSLFDVSFARGYEGGDTVGFVPFRQQKIDDFLEGIASGERALSCAKTVRTGCPWFPDGLDKAKILKSDPDSALIAVDNKENIRSWLVLHNIGGQWMVIAAPDRLQHAELYATGEFRDKMVRYRDAVTRQFERKARKDAEYGKEVAEAAGKAKRILETAVTISGLSFSLGSGVDENYLTISMALTNEYPELLRVTSVLVDFCNESGEIFATKEYASPSEYIDPGKSVPYTIATVMRDEESLDMARKLVKGVYTGKARCHGLMIGERNLHIDPSGGGLKPRR